MLGALLAIFSAASFAATNAAARRGVVTGTPAQGMVLTNPVGVICFSGVFFGVAIAAGELTRLGEFPLPAAAWMAGVGVLHFICGRYANFRANQSAGTNLTAPVIQLNSVVTLVLAVVVLGEPCTVLQVIGGITMISGALVAQRQVPVSMSAGPLRFSPRKAEGFLFAVFAALAYGTTPIMTRTALQSAGPSGAIIGGLIAYSAATVVVAIMLLSSAPLRRNLMALKRESVRWFVYSGVFVAVAQGFLYSAVSVAPIMLVMPLLQLSLVFRLFFSAWLNPEHEVFGARVIVGCVISLAGASTVAIDTEIILHATGHPA
jgi:drug/metabolite transporter (DMT)-like permease